MGINPHDFRVLPYQMNPALDGIQLTWFTVANIPGTILVTGPGLAEPLTLASAPVLVPELDYQTAGELNATGAFPFATTAVFDAPGVPARNWRHRLQVTGLQADTEYTYTVTQGGSSYSNTFRTAPTPATNRPLRFIAISDSETLVFGRTRFREWARTTPQTGSSTGRPAGRDQYFLTETVGYQENIKQIEARDADLLLFAGDLVEGTTTENQRRWDEFWRHNAGSYNDLLGGIPVVAAIGNNDIYNGSTNPLVQYARQQWSAYFDYPANNDPLAKDLYHRVDYGPITVITLSSVGALGANDNVAPPQGQDTSVNFPENRDTNRAWLLNYPYGDLPDFNIGTPQWNWAMQELAAARAAGQIIFVQWHHTPFSRGIHGSSVTSTQSGEAMRIYAPLLEQYRVAAVFTGHSEVAEMSYFDLNNDGYGVHLWDVGAAGDGLRGVEDAPGATAGAITNWRNNPLNPQGASWQMNPHHVWSADQSEPETWEGNKLVSGGKHYGFLECDIERLPAGGYRLTFQNWHTFPLNAGDANFTVTGYELRPYTNRVVLEGQANDLRPVPADDTGDTTAPLITSITAVGTQIQVQFSEPVVTTNLTAARFSATVAGIARTVDALSQVAGDPTRLNLTLSGIAPTSAQALALRYTDLTASNDDTGVLQDASGNDMATISAPGRNVETFSAITNVVRLAASYSDILLTGTATRATGNAGDNRLHVNQATAIRNVFMGGDGIDDMDAGEGSDTYIIITAVQHGAAEISDSGAGLADIDELRFASITAGETLSVFAGDTGLERVSIGTGIAANPVSTATTALSINAAAAPNPLTIIGNNGPNSLIGTAFNDVLIGNGGNDAMDGRDGSDIYHITSSSHRSAAEINDTGTSVGDIDELRFASTTNGETITINASDSGLERVTLGTGTAAAAVLTAVTSLHINASASTKGLSLLGNFGFNTITGSPFHDLLNGHRGNDTLSGGAGIDTFRFDSALHATTNRDTITDFNPAEDRIELKNRIFTALLSTGPLAASAFGVGSAATTPDQRILYNSATGTLTYDSNGNATGGATIFASLSTGLALSSAMFTIT